MKIVFLTRFDFITDKKDGGLLASSRNYEMLCELYGKENILLCILSPHKKQSMESVKYIKTDSNLIVTYIHYIMLKDRISSICKRKILKYILSEQPDLIFYDGSTFGQIIKNRKLREINNVVFFHNIERQYTWEQVKKYSKLCIFRYLATRFNERKNVKYANKIICLNKRDRDLLANFYDRKADMILPVTFKDTFMNENKPQNMKNVDLLYVGSYYAHNFTGLIWFIEHVMPQINRHLTIVGKNMEKLREKIEETDRIHIIGTVEDVSVYYISSSAVVMPIFMGGGMKVKTAEAMMYGKKIFASKEALEGYAIDGIRGIFLCNTEEDFVRKINSYFEKNECNNFDQEIRNLFLEKYSTNNFLISLKKCIEDDMQITID